jgi:hypothetical protein
MVRGRPPTAAESRAAQARAAEDARAMRARAAEDAMAAEHATLLARLVRLGMEGATDEPAGRSRQGRRPRS